MRLVYDEESHPTTLERFEMLGGLQALGREEHDVVAPLFELVLVLGAFVRCDGRVEARGFDSGRSEALLLILHQRDQRRDHDDDALEEQRRQLIAKRLSRPRGQNTERVPSREDRVDELALAWAEALDAKVVA